VWIEYGGSGPVDLRFCFLFPSFFFVARFYSLMHRCTYLYSSSLHDVEVIDREGGEADGWTEHSNGISVPMYSTLPYPILSFLGGPRGFERHGGDRHGAVGRVTGDGQEGNVSRRGKEAGCHTACSLCVAIH
jgi:hypothetical protein